MIIIFPPMYSWDATAPSGGPWYDSSFAIAVNGLYIRNGETTAVPFDPIEIGASGTLTYSLVNNGSETVILTGDPYVAVSGEDFFISSQPSSDTLLADESVDFDITFAPTESGVRNAYISVANDTEDDPYTILVYGRGSSQLGIFAGGYASQNVYSSIEYLSITTLSNSEAFGDLVVSRQGGAGCSSSTRGIFAGGSSTDQANNPTNTIQYITFSTLSESSLFGELLSAVTSNAGASSETIGLIGGGTGNSNVVEYITIATLSNSVDYGDLTVGRSQLSACGNSTRAIFGGGASGTWVNIIDYVAISTPASFSDFGDLSVARYRLSSCSNSTTGLFIGGITTISVNTIDYITIASAGNATDFGDTDGDFLGSRSCSSPTRAVFAGGTPIATPNEQINYLTIASPGNSQDFGDLSTGRYLPFSVSNCHGGLG